MNVRTPMNHASRKKIGVGSLEETLYIRMGTPKLESKSQ